jgi:hypothetical protein
MGLFGYYFNDFLYFKDSFFRVFYVTMILDYTENAEHDDAPDSAASLIRQFEKCGHIGDKASILYGR